MRNVYLFQPQYAVDVRNETNYWLPYSAACLWSYAQQFDDIQNNYTLAELIFRREHPNEILTKLKDPFICGFSSYVWNEQYCLEVAKKIKERWPNCFIVFGGPQTSLSTLNYEFIDTVIISEGEDHFLSLLRDLLQDKTPPRSYLKSRISDLNIPSPYVLGLFDDMIAKNPSAVWAMVLETNRGCPYACTFCDWGSLTSSKIFKFDLDKIAAELDWAAKNPVTYMFIADANFGIFKERDLEIARLIRKAADQGRLEVVNATYAKNSTENIFEISKTLGDLCKGVTVSVQSMNENTLDAIKRKNLSINNIQHLLDLSKKYDVSTYTEVILGLPLETLDTWKSGLAEILELGQHDAIEVWLCQILENSELASLQTKLKYGINTITANDYMPYFNPTDYREIDEVIKLVNSTNTMPTEDIVEGYMYGWMIIQFHIMGYCQLYAKFARNVLNVRYRDFYDAMFNEIKYDPVFSTHFHELKESVFIYLTDGKISANVKAGHFLSTPSFKFIFDHVVSAYDLGLSVLKKFNQNVKDIDILQRNFIFQQDVEYPITINANLDLDSWLAQGTNYLIFSRLIISDNFDFYIARRKGKLKNSFTKIDNLLDK